MKFGTVIGIVVVGGAVALAAATIWPDSVNALYPGWGSQALAIRAALPVSIASALPPYPAADSDTATPVATNATAAAPSQNAASAAPPQTATAARPGRPASGGAAAGPPLVSVDVVTVQRGPMPYRLDTVGTVQPVASIAIRTRVDAQIQDLLVPDGASVKAGQVLVKLDSRQIEAQIAQAQAALTRDQALLDQGNRDLVRFQALLTKGSGTQINYDNQLTLVSGLKASILGDKASLDNLKVQLGWYTITAPIAGRLGVFSAKPGNIIRAADNTATGTLATLNQMAPIYVTFSVPQAILPDLRAALAAGGGDTDVTPQGSKTTSHGKLAYFDNAVDPNTGSVTVHAVIPNADEALWPGQLVNLRLNLRLDPEVVSIPREATQSSAKGTFVYVIDDNVAHIRYVTEGRQQDSRDIVTDGLKGGETIVVTGALLLRDGSKVAIKNGQSNKGAT